MIKKDNLSPEQEIAANPQQNIWVQANAGTGKTSVLTARLLRILFRGGDKTGGILCLTYTNAAAGEMRNRILAALRTWAMASDQDLCELLQGITTNKTPTAQDIAHARQIFFTYIDNPNILKIKTIHGFCEEILRRFPTEAGISPSWKLISDAPQRVLLNKTLEDLINSPTNDERTIAAFNHIINTVSEYKLDALLKQIEQQYKTFFIIKDFINYRKYFIDTIEKKLNIKHNKIDKKPLNELNKILVFAKSEKKQTVTLLNLITKTKQNINDEIDFDEYKKIYLTSEGYIKQRGLTQEYLENEKNRVLNQNAAIINKKIFNDTIALFDLSAAFAKKYQELKQIQNVLDFEDLILYTHKLFSNPQTMGWILSQMDQSLSHILVDEAQDTGPIQWELLKMLSGDFFTEGDENNIPRTLFVVGDTKQSIYGFQGADPAAFASSRSALASYITNNARQIREVPLTQSFRSVEPILKTVDMFFGDKNVARKTGFLNNPHKCFRVGEHGLVEIHKLVTPGDLETRHVRQTYINTIATKISELLTSGKYKPDDIMILVQNRLPFATPMANELKRRSIQVAGSDRIVLPNFPIIRDLMNLVRFCINNSDDYSLACVLKSPIFDQNDADVYNLCILRNPENNLFNAIKNAQPKLYEILCDFIDKCSHLGPYSFFTYVLDNYQTREKMIAALGPHIIDPLEEFITICLAYERTNSGTLRHFIKWFITGNSEIKRDMDSGEGVKIVTVHGSKGLQAPVIFLIDTTATPKKPQIFNIPTNDNSKPVWLWTPRNQKEFSPDFEEIKSIQIEREIEESFRLLYVAMTRACDELYIYGFSANKTAPEMSWHNMLWETLNNKPDTYTTDDIIRISNYDDK